MSQAPARRSARLTILLLCTIAAGCGGRQGRTGLWELGTEPGEGQAADIFDIVPASAKYAYVIDMTATDAVLFREQWRSNPFARAATEEIQAQTGVDVLSEEGIEAIGIDLEGEIAFFSTRLAPIIIFRLADPTAFRDFLADIQTRNPDVDWSKFRLGGANFLSGTRDGRAFDAAVMGEYAVFRLRLGDPDNDVDDDTLSAIVLGKAGPGLRQDPRVLALRTRSELEMNAIGVVDTGALLDTIDVVLGEMAEGDPEYVDDAQRETCQAAVDRVIEAVPWLGALRVRDPEAPDVQRYWYVAHLGEQARERAAALLSGTFTGAFQAADDAAFYVAGNVDLAGLAGIMAGDTTLTECPDAGAIPGHLARAGEWLRPVVVGTPLDGLAALAVYDIDFGGMFPRVDLVLALGASAPIEVVEAIQTMLETNGAAGSVDETAPYTTVEYDILGYHVRLLKLDDRVLVTVGDVSVGLTNALAASVARVPGQPFHQARVNGPRLAEIARGWFDYVVEMGAAGTSEIDLLNATLANYERLRWMTADARVDGEELVVEVAAEYEPPGAGD